MPVQLIIDLLSCIHERIGTASRSSNSTIDMEQSCKLRSAVVEDVYRTLSTGDTDYDGEFSLGFRFVFLICRHSFIVPFKNLFVIDKAGDVTEILT